MTEKANPFTRIAGDAFAPNGLPLDSLDEPRRNWKAFQRNIMRAMATNGDGAVRRDQTSDLQLLVDSAPSLIHTGRPDGYLDFFNQTWLRYVGRPLEDLQDWKWTAFIHPEDVEGIVEKWRASLTSGEPFLHEARVLRADGEYRWMLHHKVAVRDGCGEIVKWYGSSIDIEDRKRAEVQLRRSTEELQRSEFYLAEGQRLAHMGSWAFDPAGFDYWSPELFRMHGLDPAGKPPTVQEYLDLVHPQDRESMVSLIEGLSVKGSPFDAIKRIVRPNGEVRYIRCVGAVENESLKKYVGSALDVTEHELVTQELRRREAYLAEAQRLSHTGSFGWRPDDGEVVWSDETYRIFEYDNTLKPTIDSVVQRVHPQDRALAQQVIDRASQTGTDFEHEYRLLLPDARVKHVHAIAHAVQNVSGDREFVGAVTDITERKTTEDKIRRLVDANILGIFIADVEGACVVGANEAFLRMLQYSREDLLARRMLWADLTPPEWYERDEHAMASLKATGTAQPYEKEFFRKDGSRVPVLVGGALFEGGSEGVAFVLDLSEQKRAEEKIRRSESYLAEAQRLSQTGSWAWSPERDIRYWSEECYRVLSFDPQDGLPRFEDFFQRLHPDDQPGFRELTQTAIREKAEWEADYRIVHPDGPVRDIHVVGHPILSTSGDLVEFVGTVIDVTERKTAEERIREQEMELRQMLDLAPQQVAVFGPGGERLYTNRMGLDYIGVSLEEWRQTPGNFFTPGGFIHPDDLERAARASSEGTRSSGSGYELELRVRGAGGNYRWFLVRFNPLHDDKGHVKRWYVALTDIEDRKLAEEKLQQENVALREEIDKASMFEEIVGTSKSLKAVLSRIAKVAPTDSTVLITGETGTGKELIARAVHKRSQRSGRPFVSVNCAALPPTLVSSELFGHEKGAFTGATQRRLGRFEMADGGTIFLDEVGELLPDTQAALLRVLQEREFERVGGGQPIKVDVRVIAATNRDLNAAVANGTFRQDLLYRLNVFPIEMPPLRERKDDILILVEYFVQRYANRTGKNIRSIDQKTLDLLQSYDWPGNIRELQNVIERSIILSSTDVFSVDELWLSKRTSPQASRAETSSALNVEPRTERETIEAALAETRGRVSGPSGAAAKLRIPPSTLETRIKALSIEKRRFKYG
jgi:PAS domain S-box-containing protein